jgi:hypothetical protein
VTAKRDSQRSRVYAWENRVIAPCDPSFVSFPAAQGMVNAMALVQIPLFGMFEAGSAVDFVRVFRYHPRTKTKFAPEPYKLP